MGATYVGMIFPYSLLTTSKSCDQGTQLCNPYVGYRVTCVGEEPSTGRVSCAIAGPFSGSADDVCVFPGGDVRFKGLGVRVG